ncbi:5'-nucleotidase C-terminal domain-containing protein [Saccharicrinis fermentans]|uniref:Trifunctional nucleotide phosphoesterase protein YfkN n=1 Tax=Saccharicrinis fermentans DSM 9555 = JCM 21142 TaxID=869213 RepID=W7XW40_9BACT|nr:5'-nucleotidase [Saccharicrinis fermentans]GAF02490.1 trifunctional nucleotide phosphoesterase protein YfkN precursor [Saccharicrinis fermentans DSM 9555 = JCM 21142]
MKLHILCVALLSLFCFTFCKQAYTVKEYGGTNITIDSNFTPDSVMSSIIAPYKKGIDAKMDSVIGVSEKDLLAHKPESELSNFVSDVIQQKAREFLVLHNADSLRLMTLMNIKGIRAPIPRGEVTVRNIFELMPFENEIVILKLRGDSIKSLFDFLGKTNGDGIAGASVVYENHEVVQLMIGGEIVRDSHNYFLATSDYLANGGDHYGMIMRPLFMQAIGSKLREAIIESIQELHSRDKKIKAKIQGRIIFN